MGDVTPTFERLRPRLLGIAYRMLGSATEAVVEGARLRWEDAVPATAYKAEALLVTIVVRLCLNRLKGLEREDKKYCKSQLPAPLAADFPGTLEQLLELADDVSVAFLAILERLPPAARTAYLLREMFDVDYDEIAQVIGKSKAKCAEMVLHARARLRARRPR